MIKKVKGGYQVVLCKPRISEGPIRPSKRQRNATGKLSSSNSGRVRQCVFGKRRKNDKPAHGVSSFQEWVPVPVLHFGWLSTRTKPGVIVAVAVMWGQSGKLQSDGNGKVCVDSDVQLLIRATS